MASALADFESLEVNDNSFLTGSLATGFCQAAAAGLQYLDISFTNINGSIPSCLLGPGNSLQHGSSLKKLAALLNVVNEQPPVANYVQTLTAFPSIVRRVKHVSITCSLGCWGPGTGSKLAQLRARMAYLSGSIPDVLPADSPLELFNVDANHLTGEVLSISDLNKFVHFLTNNMKCMLKLHGMHRFR